MSRFAQYYAKYKHDAGCYDWEQRQQHLGALFDKDESIEFYMGEGTDRKVYKHRVYHLRTHRCLPPLCLVTFRIFN